jgi:hypothetical protein
MENVCEFMLKIAGDDKDTPDDGVARSESAPPVAGDSGPARCNFVTDWYLAEADCKAGQHPITP